nr:spore coat U domain-containing protein [Serratia symbiotica]
MVSACEASSTSSGNNSFGSLNFGALYSLSSAVSAASQQNAGAIRVKCNNGTSYTVLLSGGRSGNTAARYLQSATGQRVNYNLYISAAHSTVWNNVTGVSQTANGVDNWLPVYGLIPAQTTPPPAATPIQYRLRSIGNDNARFNLRIIVLPPPVRGLGRYRR